jgi:hypothetical protein
MGTGELYLLKRLDEILTQQPISAGALAVKFMLLGLSLALL